MSNDDVSDIELKLYRDLRAAILAFDAQVKTIEDAKAAAVFPDAESLYRGAKEASGELGKKFSAICNFLVHKDGHKKLDLN